LLRLDVSVETSRNTWDGCSPLMLAATANDVYGA
jgi:hypothetical protein